MNLLHKTDYHLVTKILKKNNIHIPTFSHSILDEYISGSVYVDSKDPKTFLIATNSGIYVIAGKEDNQNFNHDLVNLYKARKKDHLRFSLFSSTPTWDLVIQEQLKNEIQQFRRYSFNFDGKDEYVSRRLSPSYSIKKIKEKMISSSLEFNEAYYKEYWGSVSNFIKKSFGFYILHQGKIVSECTSIFSSNQFVEIDIATHKEYRGLGLGSTIGKAYIDYSLERQLIPRWDCDVSNMSSIKLAEKLGFTNPKPYSVFV
ncbi:GNAT family N-acetyltransferase [Metabacillus litoralis]|uniref:GNAT family N-acetyltransferase n=1 Tax=Metabacillus litoralis TaxID=152268 RepID=UPI001CFEDF43|nr:GNAT family N-acetyltransferase [Metabacillus litoralis]